MRVLKQSTASQIIKLGPFLDSTDGDTEETGLTIANTDIKISKAGGTYANKNSGGGTHDADGFYTVTLDATDTNTVGRLQIYCHMSGALMVTYDAWVVEEAVYDMLFASGGLGYIANAPVNVAQISGNTQAADNLQTMTEDDQGLFLALYAGPEGPGVYCNSNASNTNTTVGTDGTEGNPVSTLTAARTLADALGIDRYYIGGGSSFTLTATHQHWHLVGLTGFNDNTINLGAAASATDVDGSLFERLRVVGTQGGSDRMVLIDCAIDDAPAAEVTTINPLAIRCSLQGDFELDDSTDHIFDSCFSGVAGNDAPEITFNASGGSAQFRHNSGGLHLRSLVASNTVSIETDGQVIFNADCNVNAEVTIRGWTSIVDNAGMTNVTYEATPSHFLHSSGLTGFDRSTDSLQALRDRGDAAWITGGGGGITQILNVSPVIPNDIDLAGTSTVRIGLVLINSVDDLPSTAEITPGTITIERKAIGGTSWSAIVTDAAMSEQAGMVYYDEVFDSGSGYAEGDSIRITFKSVSITADTNTHEICDANGVLFQTSIRQTMRGTNSAALASDWTSSRAGYLDNLNVGETLPTQADITGGAYALDSDANGRMRVVDGTGAGEISLTNGLIDWNAAWDAEVQSEVADALAAFWTSPSNLVNLIWNESAASHPVDGTTGYILDNIGSIPTVTEIRVEMDSNSTQLAAILADSNELQGDWTNGGRLDLLIDAILADSNELQSDWADGGRLDLLLDALPSQSDITGGAYSLDTDANGRMRIVDGTGAGELDTSNGLIAGISGTKNTFDDLNDIASSNILTTQLTESYAANGVAPTLVQALFAIHQKLMQHAYSGTNSNTYQLDNSSLAFVGTLDDGTNPTEDRRVAA